MRALLLLVGMTLFPTSALADDYPPDVVAVLAGENKKATELTFVGRSGQIYRPEANTWKRQHVGGIASDVVGAVRVGRKLYAISKRAPMFLQKNGVWDATPLANRGYAAFADRGSAIMVALGRHLYRLEKGSWTRFATASRRVTAMYPAAKNRVYVATTRGRLRRTDGTNFAIIKNPLPTDDYVKTMLGRPGGELYGVTKAGTLMQIGASTATEVPLDGPLQGFEIHALGHGPKKAIYAAGVLAASDGSRTSLLVELKAGAGKQVAELPTLAAKDRLSLVHTARDNRLVVATFSGKVHLQNADGSWETRLVSGSAPPARAASNQPARSR